VVGVTQTLTGDALPAIRALQKKADSWIQTIKSTFLPCHLLWTAMHHVLWPSLWYPLSVTTMSPSQAHQTTSRLYQTLLPRLGVNRHFPTPLHYATPAFLGLGLPDPYWEQGISAIRLFLEQANSDTTESQLLHTSLEYLHLELGTATNPLELSYDLWSPLATDCWLKSLWWFADFAKISLRPSLPIIPPPTIGRLPPYGLRYLIRSPTQDHPGHQPVPHLPPGHVLVGCC